MNGDRPISPAPVTEAGPDFLPPYLANGVIGLRVRDVPLLNGWAVVNGLAGEHPVERVECTPQAPYPLAGDLRVGDMRLSDFLPSVDFVDQRYDFSCGELTSRFEFRARDATATVEVVTFCSRTKPTVVAQSVVVQVDRDCELELSAKIDPRDIPGKWVDRLVQLPGQDDPAVDGALEWETLGGRGRCGVAYWTRCSEPVERTRAVWDDESPLVSSYTIDAHAGRRYVLEHAASLVPSAVHDQPHLQAVRLLAQASGLGFERLRDDNRAEWDALWRGRVRLLGADERWQALVDAAFFYLNSSVHSSSLCSTHIFGLAQWHNYHYYFGHVMWDIDAFAQHALVLSQPEAVKAMLEYRHRSIQAAWHNARMNGYRGLQFPWQSSPTDGSEAAPGGGSAAAHEHHITPNVALAFARYVLVTGDANFDRERAWPVLSGSAEWIESRVARSPRGYEIRQATGIAERKEIYDNSAYVNIMARRALREAIACAERTGMATASAWGDIAGRLVVPIVDGVIQDHDGYDPKEEKGATPAALAALFPGGCAVDPAVARATTEFYLALADEYVGSPMLSALYPTWAARIGDRHRAAELLEEGYAKFTSPRFMNTHEYREDRFPNQPVSGPFVANMAALLLNCYFGFTGLEPDAGDPAGWSRMPVAMPAGWDGLEVESVAIRGRAMKLIARHGESARLEPCS